MSEQDNGHAPQPGQVQLHAEITPQGTVLNCAYPVQLGIPAETMDAWSEEWVMNRPQLLLKIVRRAKEAQKQELAIIRHVQRSKVN